MTIKLGKSLTLIPPPGPVAVDGRTCGRIYAVGTARYWTLKIKGHVDITIRDTSWDTGDRDIRTEIPDPNPKSTPKELASLYGKRRAGIHPASDGDIWMTAWTVKPRADGWPEFKKPSSLAVLHDTCGSKLIDAACDQGVRRIASKKSLLGTEDKTRNELCALIGHNAADTAPVALYTVTRIAPTLRHINWI